METKRIVDINTYWAEIIRDTAQFGQIAVAENPEFNRLADCIFRALEDSFIHSATEYGVKRWESMLQIAPSAGDTLEDRKARILTYLNLKLPYTWRVLKQLIEGIVGEGNYNIEYVNDTQTLTIDVPLSHLESVKDLTSRVIPMNLDVEYFNDGLPGGYLPCMFLKTNHGSYMKTDIVPHNLMGARCIVRSGTQAEGASGEYYFFYNRESYSTNSRWISLRPSIVPGYSAFTGWGKFYRPGGQVSGINDCLLNYKNSRKVGFVGGEKNWIDLPELPYTPITGLYIGIDYKNKVGPGHYLYYGELTEGEEITYIFVPAIDRSGAPCFYEKKHKKTYNDASGKGFIVGLTMEQALHLNKLSTSGGTLTISLPTGYESDSAVVKALDIARANGWTLTVQTHSDSAIMTLDLFDIWVRKTQDENGQYVDSDGTRWHVEWCNCMYTHDGSTERDHGYELHPSVEKACNIWGLSIYENLTEEGIEQ